MRIHILRTEKRLFEKQRAPRTLVDGMIQNPHTRATNPKTYKFANNLDTNPHARVADVLEGTSRANI